MTPGQWYNRGYFKMSTRAPRETAPSGGGERHAGGDYTTVNFDAAHPLKSFDFSPTWGGIDGTKAEEDFFWYDDVR